MPRRGDRRRVEHDLGAAMSIVGNCEVRSPRGKQRQHVRDDAAVHRKMMARLVVGRAGAEVEFEAGQVEGIVLAKKGDRVGEGVARERRIVDRELCLDSVRLARRRPERGTMPRCQLSESVHRIEMAHEASPRRRRRRPAAIRLRLRRGAQVLREWLPKPAQSPCEGFCDPGRKK